MKKTKKLFLLAVIVLICFGLFYFLSVISCDAKGGKGKAIYIVPDLSTYIYYVSLWDKDSRIPIFLEEDKYLKKFLKSYGKARVEKVERKEIGEINAELVYRALYASWGAENVTEIDEEITKDKLKNRLKEIGVEPEGIVITNLNSEEFAGGFALAAAHKEILDFYESDAPYVGSLNTNRMSTTFEKKEKIRKDLIKILDSWGYEYAGLGKGIDYITLALDISLGCRNYDHLQPSRGVRAGFSLDDAINRLSAGAIDPKARPSQIRSNCYAYVGRLLEAEKNMAVYQAMCSLFLDVDKMLYFDQWSPKLGKGCADGVYIIGDKAKVTLVPPGKSTLKKWHKVTGRESQYDFIHINSAGSAKKWRDGEVSDIPQSIPVIVYFAQSNSARNPKDNDTIAGRWLRNGAYIYYGAVAEPYAESFNSARNVARSITKNEPLGKASQQKETLIAPFTYSWKLVYIGDPLHRIEFSSR